MHYNWNELILVIMRQLNNWPLLNSQLYHVLLTLVSLHFNFVLKHCQ
jgi:hypothetical protein